LQSVEEKDSHSTLHQKMVTFLLDNGQLFDEESEIKLEMLSDHKII